MAEDTMVVLEKGTGKSEEAQHIEIPDLWHLAMWLKDCDGDRTRKFPETKEGFSNAWFIQQGEMVLDTWHKAHALRTHIIEH